VYLSVFDLDFRYEFACLLFVKLTLGSTEPARVTKSESIPMTFRVSMDFSKHAVQWVYRCAHLGQERGTCLEPGRKPSHFLVGGNYREQWVLSLILSDFHMVRS
jgi:hypothetical protein